MGKPVFNPELTPEEWLAREHDHDANVDFGECLFAGLIAVFVVTLGFIMWIGYEAVSSIVVLP